MMSLGTIREISRQATAKAKRNRKAPFVVEKEDLQDWKQIVASGSLPRLPFPFIGDYTPRGYQKVDEFFVDSTGFGRPGEPALTVPQLIEKLQVGKAYSISECGQFQLYIREFVVTKAAS